MYARDYGDYRLAQAEYAMLGAGAAACLSCTSRACAGACPYGVATEQLAGATHLALADGNPWPYTAWSARRGRA
jgi:hypothetical protein